jgi:hypothetical protein
MKLLTAGFLKVKVVVVRELSQIFTIKYSVEALVSEKIDSLFSLTKYAFSSF